MGNSGGGFGEKFQGETGESSWVNSKESSWVNSEVNSTHNIGNIIPKNRITTITLLFREYPDITAT